ncbi:MAG: PAS domain-containing protein [Eggerthellales bacterium]|nr:PAS domain-containing protein [Eggerthellales bacterium]
MDVNLNPYFKSIVDYDDAPVVICNTEHLIVYMNPAAVRRYSSAGGQNMVGQSIMDCHNPKTQERMKRILAWFKEDPQNNSVYEGPGTSEDKDVYMVALRDNEGQVIGYYEKHAYRNRETAPKFAPIQDLLA